MNISKTIKNQALSYLSKDNWGVAIAGFLIMLLPAATLIMVFSSLQYLPGLFLNKQESEFISSILFYLLFPLLLLTTPVLTGYLKICYDISKGKNVQIKDMFFYYQKGRYFKTLYMNTAIIAKTAVAFIVTFFPAFIAAYMYNTFDNILFYILAVFLGLCGLLATLFWGIRYIFIPCVFFENDSFSYSQITEIAKMYKKSKIDEVYKLLFSFLPHILLCFFVVPWIFVFPYICVAFMNNGKWINELYKNTHKDVSPQVI